MMMGISGLVGMSAMLRISGQTNIKCHILLKEQTQADLNDDGNLCIFLKSYLYPSIFLFFSQSEVTDDP